MACRILEPQLGKEPRPSTVKWQSLNHEIMKEFSFFPKYLYLHISWPLVHSLRICTGLRFTEKFGPWLRSPLHHTSCPYQWPSHPGPLFCDHLDFIYFSITRGDSFTGSCSRFFSFSLPKTSEIPPSLPSPLIFIIPIYSKFALLPDSSSVFLYLGHPSFFFFFFGHTWLHVVF